MVYKCLFCLERSRTEYILLTPSRETVPGGKRQINCHLSLNTDLATSDPPTISLFDLVPKVCLTVRPLQLNPRAFHFPSFLNTLPPSGEFRVYPWSPQCGLSVKGGSHVAILFVFLSRLSALQSWNCTAFSPWLHHFLILLYLLLLFVNVLIPFCRG